MNSAIFSFWAGMTSLVIVSRDKAGSAETRSALPASCQNGFAAIRNFRACEVLPHAGERTLANASVASAHSHEHQRRSAAARRHGTSKAKIRNAAIGPPVTEESARAKLNRHAKAHAMRPAIASRRSCVCRLSAIPTAESAGTLFSGSSATCAARNVPPKPSVKSPARSFANGPRHRRRLHRQG